MTEVVTPTIDGRRHSVENIRAAVAKMGVGR
jgi:hypothetical protein